jgi:predicted dehydrogenase
MGLSHLRGLGRLDVRVQVVDPRRGAEADARALAAEPGFRAEVEFHRSLESVHAADAAVLAETATGRLERFEALLDRGVRRVLVEKPVEQSRKRTRHLADAAASAGADVHVDFVFRTLPLYRRAREGGGDFRLTVTGGAFGLACNGIHFLDLAVFLSGGEPGSLAYAYVEPEPVESPRGPEFRDYGGEIVCAFGRSRASVAAAATRGGPIVLVLERENETVVVDLQRRRALVDTRGEEALPPYRYGAGYERTEVADPHRLDLPSLTRAWASGTTSLPTLAESLPAHELLFDALETTGETDFAVT